MAPPWWSNPIKTKRSKSNGTAVSTEPEVLAQILTQQAEGVLDDATEMVNSIRDAKHLRDLTDALIVFIASLDNLVLSDGDLLYLAAIALVWQRKSDKESAAMFGETLDWARREAAFFGAPVSK
jgi:hypothetical protein